VGSEATTFARADQPPATPVSTGAAEAARFSAAVCPVVYQLDESPGTRGYRYIFYGNAFFINRDGYLLTAAHVLSEFGNGGQASILLRSGVAPPRLVKVKVIASDIDHDVAILRATPNPFAGPFLVAALPLAGEKPAVGEPIEATALRPSHMRDPHTFELPVADSYPATVLGYRSMSLSPETKASSQTLPRPTELTDLFLFSHEVQRGQSGAPVTRAATGEVVGIIEGRWLHPAARSAVKTAGDSGPSSPLTLTQGAAVSVPYALALLQKNNIRWSASSR
jgi:hypothetical protein